MRAPSFEQATAMALDSRYALTGGVFSRYPRHLEYAREHFRVGDLYLNRRITGVQAGGPEYLQQFMWSRVVSENTVRHGYVA